MNSLPFVLHLFHRILRGGRYRKATPEELRGTGATLSLVGLGALIGLTLYLSLDPEAWTLSPVRLWTWVVLFLFPLVIFFFWVEERVPPVWSISVGLLIPVAVFAYVFLCPSKPLPPSVAAQAGLMLHIVLTVAGPAIGKAR